MAPSAYTVTLTDATSSFSTLLTNAEAGDMPEPGLNTIPTATFTMAMFDTQTALCIANETEVIIKRGSTVKFRGPIRIATDSADGLSVEFGCEGLIGYFADRCTDRGAGRVNLMLNPSFEADADGTRPITDWPETGVTSEVDTAQHVLGGASAKLTQASAGVDSYISQTITFTSRPIGDLLTVAAWFYISGADWVGPPIESWGSIVRQLQGGEPVNEQWGFRGDENQLDSDTPRDSWQRFETTTWVAPSQTVDIEIRLYAPGGVIWWDALSLTQMESFSPSLEDQAEILLELVDFLQGTHVDFGDIGKNNVSITADSTSCAPTGVTRTFSAQFADHMNGLTGGLQAFCGLDDGVEVWVDPVTRKFWCATQRGTDRTATVTLTGDSNCIFKRYTFDAHQGASQVVALGVGDGPDREEGAASDGSVFGGLTVQRILPAVGTPRIDTLPARAAKELAVAKVPEVYELEVIDSTLVGTLGLGDLVASSISHGCISESRNLRIVGWTLHPASDTLTITANVAPGASLTFGDATFGSGTFGRF